jgi:dipeptidyl aminopeptidase/acylaminoacyl peptidase
VRGYNINESETTMIGRMWGTSKRAIILLALALITPAAYGQDTVFTAHHVAKTRMVTSAVVSPDGSQVAYLLTVPRQLPKEKDGLAWTELHVVDQNGTSTPFIVGQVNIDAIAWTPDGKSISFLAKRDKDEHRSLYVIPTRGGEARKVLAHGADIQSYSWSPGGKQVAFLAAEPTPKDRKTEQDQGFNQEIYEEDNQFVRVWTADVPDGKAKMVKLEGSASEVRWHPKDNWLAVAVAPTPLIDDWLMTRKIRLVHLESGQSFDLKNPGKIGQFEWSPDGKMVALISGADKHDPKEGRLWIETDQMKGWTDVLPDFKGHVESIAWHSPDIVIYQASEGAWTTVGAVRLKNNGGKVGYEKSGVGLGPGGPILSNLTASRDGKTMAFIGHTPKHPPEIFYLFEPEDKQPRRLTDSNPWLRTMRFAEQEVVKHKARDGLELEGILVRPLGEKKGQRYPLVMTVHGGPEAHMSNGWVTLYHSLGQVGAARGLAVFYPNYRGSTGRGVEFSMMGQKAAAKAEFDDLVDAVDHLVDTGLVDKKKVGITGGSYGGYATAWGSTYYSDRFAAGVMFVGISDNISKVGTTDIPQEMVLVHHRQYLWDDWNYFLKSSPIYYLDKAKTPLLILHGKNDPRVHPSQSLELYRHLKTRNQAPVRLVLYPGEGHGNRRAASRLDYNLRLLRWMEHYLKGPGGAMPPREIDYGLSDAKKSAAAGSWRELPLRVQAESPSLRDSEATAHRGRDCPCCIGW